MPTLQEQQITIENKYSRHNIRYYVQQDILNSDLEDTISHAIKLVIEYLYENTYYESKHKRITQLLSTDIFVRDIVEEVISIVSQLEGIVPIQAVASKLGTYLKYEDIFDGIKTASEFLAVIYPTNLFDIITAKNSETGSLMISSNISLEDKTIEFIKQTKYLPPMICKPKKVVSNRTSGYLTKNDSIILGSENHHNDKQALDALNIANQIPLSLDMRMVNLEETSKKPLDTPQKLNAHNQLADSSYDVYEELLAHGNKFYLTWKYDKRGRVYSQGYHVNIQSSSYKKSIINLAEEHTITI